MNLLDSVTMPSFFNSLKIFSQILVASYLLTLIPFIIKSPINSNNSKTEFGESSETIPAMCLKKNPGNEDFVIFLDKIFSIVCKFSFSLFKFTYSILFKDGSIFKFRF